MKYPRHVCQAKGNSCGLVGWTVLCARRDSASKGVQGSQSWPGLVLSRLTGVGARSWRLGVWCQSPAPSLFLPQWEAWHCQCSYPICWELRAHLTLSAWRPGVAIWGRPAGWLGRQPGSFALAPMPWLQDPRACAHGTLSASSIPAPQDGSLASQERMMATTAVPVTAPAGTRGTECLAAWGHPWMCADQRFSPLL